MHEEQTETGSSRPWSQAAHCVQNPQSAQLCRNRVGKKHCKRCKDFQEVRRKAKNRQSAQKSRLNRNDRRGALAATVKMNQLSLAQAETTLERQLAEKAAFQVQIEEMLELMHSMARGNLKKSTETTQTATTALKVAP